MNERDLYTSLRMLWNNHTEVCGLVLQDHTIYAVNNVATEADRAFEFSIPDLNQFMKNHKVSDVLGVYHTHPSNSIWPSDADIAGWPSGENLRYWIVTQQAVTEWEKCNDGGVRIAGSALDTSIHRPATQGR